MYECQALKEFLSPSANLDLEIARSNLNRVIHIQIYDHLRQMRSTSFADLARSQKAHLKTLKELLFIVYHGTTPGKSGKGIFLSTHKAGSHSAIRRDTYRMLGFESPFTTNCKGDI